jgi:hypothetical protein
MVDYNVFIGFMEAQVNLEDGSRWSPDSLLKKYYSNGLLTVATDSVVEKVRIQLYYIIPVLPVLVKI